MSLKALEMQIALPRTQEAGRIQGQYNERSSVLNSQAHIAVQKEEEMKRKTITENEELSSLKWQKDEKRHLKDMDENKKGQEKNKKKSKDEHPYKGKYVDMNL